MAKPEWGTKRICQECTAKFYDMQRAVAVCPKCGTTFVPPAPKQRRARAPVPEPVAAAEPVPQPVDPDAVEAPAKAEDDELEGVADIADVEVDDDDDDEDANTIEDVADLGDDGDDVGVVIEKADGKNEE